MWDPQIEALGQHFHVLRYDSRGHGNSDVPAGPYSVDRLGRDAVELLDALKIGRAHFLGLSLGGMVGQWLGIHAPERIDRLILAMAGLPKFYNTERSQRTQRQKLKITFIASVFVVFVTFPYCECSV
jgi:pimeloyl-ACP methyl ester carboxylesterase